MNKMFRCNRRVDTLKYFVRRMSQYPPSMQIKTLNLEQATARDLMDEVIRIAVVDFKVLSAKLAKVPLTVEDRAHLDYLMAKHAIESVLADKYLDRLEQMLPNIPPGRLQRVLRRREVAIYRKYKIPIRHVKTFKKLGLSIFQGMQSSYAMNGQIKRYLTQQNRLATA
ncbi:uncharacterized protein LOC113503858 [Trichoplusia ni]|uniref:Uncharacterized protein LOC113503858 n=1 Tax=Trichoplusia ni TaxID=7111 RepID=A0A7E5WM15_TRINI|nr:uncharacterized protein LOC113503858 [Trichoplusia ni]XP_026741773.1 uncharacterized protein LOC113503858 [Trichoplusia ni]